jgi:hypothetical protein
MFLPLEVIVLQQMVNSQLLLLEKVKKIHQRKNKKMLYCIDGDYFDENAKFLCSTAKGLKEKAAGYDENTKVVFLQRSKNTQLSIEQAIHLYNTNKQPTMYGENRPHPLRPDLNRAQITRDTNEMMDVKTNKKSTEFEDVLSRLQMQLDMSKTFIQQIGVQVDKLRPMDMNNAQKPTDGKQTTGIISALYEKIEQAEEHNYMLQIILNHLETII